MSKNDELSLENLIGIVVGGIGVVAIILFIKGFMIAAPASYYLLSTVFLLGISALSNNIWFKAAKAILIPATIGFAILSICLFIFNFHFPTNYLSHQINKVEDIEFIIIELHKKTAFLQSNNWWLLPIILCFLIYLSKVTSNWKIITNFLWFQRIISIILASIAIITSFSFFTDTQILTKIAKNAEQHVTVQFVYSRQKERREIAKYLAVKSTVNAINSLPDNGKLYIASLIKASTLPKSNFDARWGQETLFKRLAWMHTPNPIKESEEDNNIISDEERQKLMDNPSVILNEQLSNEKIARTFAENEKQEGLEFLLRTPLSAGTYVLKDLYKAFLQQIIDEELATIASVYLGKVTEKVFEERTAPLVKKYSAALQKTLYPDESNQISPNRLAESNVQKVFRYFAIDVAKFYYDKAKTNIDDAKLVRRLG